MPERCLACASAIPAAEHFCLTCGRPTLQATPDERAAWEVLEWRRARERSGSVPPAAEAPAPVVKPPKPFVPPAPALEPQQAPAALPVAGLQPAPVHTQQPTRPPEPILEPEPDDDPPPLGPSPLAVPSGRPFVRPGRDLRDRLLRGHARRDPVATEDAPDIRIDLEPPVVAVPEAAEEPAEEAETLRVVDGIQEPELARQQTPSVSPPLTEPPKPADDRAARYLRKALRPMHVFVDIGARAGRYALAAATVVDGTGRILAVEADVAKAEKLVALRGHGASQIEVVHALLGPADAPVSEGSMPLRTLDDVLFERDVETVDFLRIDVAGAAPDVLAGAAGLLTRGSFHGPVMIQIDSPALAARGYEPEDVLRWFPSGEWADTTGLRLGAHAPGAPVHVRVFERR